MGRIDELEALLGRAEGAHAVYEETVLNGVYDQEWPRWYAAYMVAHGIGAIVGHAVAVDRLAGLLTSGWSDYQREHPDRIVPWATYIARRIAAEA